MERKCNHFAYVLALAVCACSFLATPARGPEASPGQAESAELASPVPTRAAAGPAAYCQDPPAPTVTDLQVYQAPEMPEPLARKEYIDPVFNTCIIRATDRSTDLAPGDASSGMKNEYSRVQPFNADESRFMIRGIDGTWYPYDANSLLPLGKISIGVDPRWDAKDPNLLYYSDGTSLYSYNITSAESSLLYDFADEFPGHSLQAVWMRYEGSPSVDSRYIGLMAEDQDWLTVGFLIYDIQNGNITASLNLPVPVEIDSVSISPSGNYFLAYFDNACEPGQLGSAAEPCGLMVYDRELKNGRGLLRLCGHSDLAFDRLGNEVLVYQDIDRDALSYVDLATGEIGNLFEIDFSHTAIGFHFSGQAYRHPGWALVSTYGDDKTAHTWMDNQVFALELAPGGRVARLAHTHSLVDSTQGHDYWAEPHASTNRDLTRILFTSNWNKSGTGEVETYLIRLPSNWTEGLTK